jgi:hypothetical protein
VSDAVSNTSLAYQFFFGSQDIFKERSNGHQVGVINVIHKVGKVVQKRPSSFKVPLLGCHQDQANIRSQASFQDPIRFVHRVRPHQLVPDRIGCYGIAKKKRRERWG